jgi:saccharopine dehydrogenase-like NADP-dependent oxidoreductase
MMTCDDNLSTRLIGSEEAGMWYITMMRVSRSVRSEKYTAMIAVLLRTGMLDRKKQTTQCKRVLVVVRSHRAGTRDAEEGTGETPVTVCEKTQTSLAGVVR